MTKLLLALESHLRVMWEHDPVAVGSLGLSFGEKQGFNRVGFLGSRGRVWFNEHSWIGVDLDGTLSVTSPPVGGTYPLGAPIKETVELVKELLTNGIKVRIFTARANSILDKVQVRVWLRDAGLPSTLPIVACKDFSMLVCIDDRAMGVIPNTGEIS